MNYADDVDWHRPFLASLAARLRPACFLELGLGDKAVMGHVDSCCGFLVGVDRGATAYRDDRKAIFPMTTDEFFASVSPSDFPAPDFVFVDADHESGQVLRDLDGLERICADNCLVAIHDTFPVNRDATASGFCYDSYLVPERLRWEHVTLPFPPGLTLCRMKPKSLV